MEISHAFVEAVRLPHFRVYLKPLDDSISGRDMWKRGTYNGKLLAKDGSGLDECTTLYWCRQHYLRVFGK